MPTPQNDLTGRQFGRLTVLAHKGKTAERYPKHLWQCRCECGRLEVVKQTRLVGKSRPITACAQCRQPLCRVCGHQIPLSYRSKTVCSDTCREVYRRQQYREDYYRRIERNPDLNREARQRLKARAADDPAVAARVRDYEARQAAQRRQRRRDDPDYAAHLARQARERYQRQRKAILARRRERWRHEPGYAEYRRADSRQRYQRHRDTILAARKRRWQAMTPEEQMQAREAQRQRVRQWSRRWRASLRCNPDALRRQRAREREWERGRQLRRLFANLDKLKTRNPHD